MRIRIMKKRGKRIVTAILAIAMLLPLVWGQTVVTEAATTNDVFSLAVDPSSTTTFARGETVKLVLKATQPIKASKIVGALSFKDKQDDSIIENAFSLVKVTAANWNAGYEKETLKFALNSNTLQTIAAGDEIATIELTVLKEIDEVKAVLSFDSLGLDVRLQSDNSSVTAVSPGGDISVPLRASITGSRGVELSLPTKIEQPIYLFTGTGTNSLRRFTVPVKITKNTGFNAMKVEFRYDNSKMSYKGYELTPKALMYVNCLTEYQGVETGASGNQKGYVSLSFVGVNDTKMTGDFLTLTFEVVSRNANPGDQVNITPTIAELQNLSETAGLSGTANTCMVEFAAGFERGDVDQNHKINLLDVTYALQGYNQVRNLTEEQMALADVNGDGYLTLVDVLLLLKYCNGETVNFA